MYAILTIAWRCLRFIVRFLLFYLIRNYLALSYCVNWCQIYVWILNVDKCSLVSLLFSAYGYFTCDFSSWPDSSCSITQDTSNSNYIWEQHSGAGPNYPTTGPQSGDGYMLANSATSSTVSCGFLF